MDDQGPIAFGDLALDAPSMLPGAEPGSFLVQASFDTASDRIRTFAREMGLAALCDLTVASVRPDFIEVLQPGTFKHRVLPNGEREYLHADDGRLQLRVIDIKLTSEPGASHFAELVYYTLALAGWFEDSIDHETGVPFSLDYVVVPDAAVWPGSHELSSMVQLVARHAAQGNPATIKEKLEAMHSELEVAEFDVFLFRLRRLFQEELPEILATGWQDLPLHITTACKHCEYLGYPWKRKDGKPTNHPDHCYPTAERSGDLSRLPFMSRGQRRSLDDGGAGSVSKLADRHQDDTLFDSHQRLRTSRTVLPYRAVRLLDQTSGLAPQAGGAATLPNFVNLRIFVTAAFEVSTAVSLAFGVEAFWVAPTAWDWHGERGTLPRHDRRHPPCQQ